MSAERHLTMAELEAGLAEIRRSPRDEGLLALIVRRPRTEEREILERGELDIELGLIGDNWQARGSSSTDDGAAHPEMQLNLMNARAIDLIAADKSRWHLAGDQLFVDLDLSGENLPPGTRLANLTSGGFVASLHGDVILEPPGTVHVVIALATNPSQRTTTPKRAKLSPV